MKNTDGFNPGAAYLVTMAVVLVVIFSIAIPSSVRDQKERDDRFAELKTSCGETFKDDWRGKALCIDMASLKVYG